MVMVVSLETTYSPDTGILDIYFLRAAVAAGCLKLCIADSGKQILCVVHVVPEGKGIKF